MQQYTYVCYTPLRDNIILDDVWTAWNKFSGVDTIPVGIV